MPDKIKVEVEVHFEKVSRGGDYEHTATDGTKSSYKVLDVKLANGQPIPIPKDAPAPRRLHRDLLAAAVRRQYGEPEPGATSDNPNADRPDDGDRTQPLGQPGQHGVVTTPADIARAQAKQTQQAHADRAKTDKG